MNLEPDNPFPLTRRKKNKSQPYSTSVFFWNLNPPCVNCQLKCENITNLCINVFAHPTKKRKKKRRIIQDRMQLVFDMDLSRLPKLNEPVWFKTGRVFSNRNIFLRLWLVKKMGSEKYFSTILIYSNKIGEYG